MKKYLGILLIMIGMVIIPGNVNASLQMFMGSVDYPCTTQSVENSKVTTCDIFYSNTSDSKFSGGTLELEFSPTHESTVVSFDVYEENAELKSSSGNLYTLDVFEIESQQIVAIGKVTWTADATLDDSQVGGTVTPTWQSVISDPSTDVDGEEDIITDDYGSSSSDMFVNSYSQEKIYNVTITWGSMEYNYVEKLDGTSEWIAITDTNGMAQGYVLVENYSNIQMNAAINFESSIEGVEANYTTDYSYYENDEEHVVSSNLDYLTLDAYVENENGYHAAVQWIVNLTGGTYDAVEEAYNNGDRKIGTVTILVGDATMGDVG